MPKDYSKLITGYDELMSFGQSSDPLKYELFYLFRDVTDEELKEQFFEAKCHLPGYCYEPELKAEFKRRTKSRLKI